MAKAIVRVLVAPRMAEFERAEHLEPAIQWGINGEFRGGDDVPEAEIRCAAEMVIERLKAAKDGKVTERMKSFQDETSRVYGLQGNVVFSKIAAADMSNS